MKRRVLESWQRDPRPGMLVITFSLTLLTFFALVAAVVLYHPFVALDMRVSAAIRGIDYPWVDTFMRAITHVGDAAAITSLTLLIAAVLIMKKRPAQAVLVTASVGVGSLIGEIARIAVERLRPGIEYARISVPDSYSLPSGHALATFILAGMVFFVVALEARHASTRFWVFAACVVIPILVALSRVYLGVHWFGDVLASWVLGAAWLTLCAAVYFALTSGDEPT